MDPFGAVLAKKRDHYRIYRVPKKSGGHRKICEALLPISQWQELAKEWFDTFPLHEAAHGFRSGRSIITNASQHQQQRYVLNIDLKDFFGSVSSYAVYLAIFDRIQRVQEVCGNGMKDMKNVLKMALTDGKKLLPISDVAGDLTSLCTLDGALPQGACTSPVLANIVATPMDRDLRRLADSQGLRYTRYADDLTFSGDEIPKWLVSRVRSIVEEHDLKVNDRKIKQMPYFQRQVVTGVVVNNETLGVSKKRRNALRQHLHFLGLKGKEIDESTKGVLEFIKSVKPGQYESLMRSYDGR